MSGPGVLHRGRFLELIKDGRWEYVRRVKALGAVFILAVTDAGELILVEQHRVPLQARTLELPAGIYGDDESAADETAERCALRELEEETGFRGTSARLVFTGPVAPGLTSEMLFMIRVEGLQRVHGGGGVGGEDITVHTVPVAQADVWLDEQRRKGLLIEPRIYAGLHLLRVDAGQRGDASRGAA
jgi:ADP-ribose pyrophosphatase